MTEQKIDLKQFMDPSFHKLELFRETAPGSFKHCKNVSGFCEAIALELGLDIDILSVAALYHDIGKMIFPKAFSENQDDKNIHDEFDPIVSYNLITRHVGDSVICLLNLDGMPIEILKIVSQHHGNMVLSSIFSKSKSTSDENFRYRTRPPQSLESAILMISDQVESISRSFSNNGKLETSEDKRDLIDSVIRKLVDDDQLDIMKVGDLKVVKRVLMKELEGMYHKRIDYPEEDEKKVKEKRNSKDLSI